VKENSTIPAVEQKSTFRGEKEMNAALILFGIVGIALSFILGWFLFSRLGPAFSAMSDDFASQRMDEMREGLLNISGSSIVKGFVVAFLAGLLSIPCVGCLFSLVLIAAGLGIK
jgi:cytochrome c biogenesis protein CcdA